MNKDQSNNIVIEGYVLPQFVELENIIIVALLEGEYNQNIIFSHLRPDDFYKESNKIIFETASELYKSGTPIDTISMFEKLKSSNKLNLIGGFEYILQLQSQLTSTANLEYHVLLLKDISISRKAIQIMHEKTKELYENKQSGEILPETIKEFELLLSRTTVNKTLTFKEAYLDTLRNLGQNQGDHLGLSTGIRSLDFLTGGLCGPDLTILAAGPGEGKSTFALNIANHVALNSGKVLYFSYEMKEEQLIFKMISNETNSTVLNVRKGNIPANALSNCKSYNADLKIFDKGETSIDQISSICKFENISNTVKLIVIDYLQLIPIGIYGQRGQTRNEQIGIISRKLKQLAMSLNVPIICLSQINRDKNRRTYRLFDLRDSGEIEQNADNVWFIWRPKIHDQENYTLQDTDLLCDNQTAIFIIEKNRLGQTGEFEMKFIGEYSRFEDLNNSIKGPASQVSDNNNLPF